MQRLGPAQHLAARPLRATVALPGAAGSLLGAHAAEREKLEDGLDSPPVCDYPNAMVRLELGPVPDDRPAVSQLLARIMGRVVDLFGTDACATHDY